MVGGDEEIKTYTARVKQPWSKEESGSLLATSRETQSYSKMQHPRLISRRTVEIPESFENEPWTAELAQWVRALMA